MRFDIPEWARSVSIRHIYLSSPGTDPAARVEFRVEEELANGGMETLLSQVKTPERNPGENNLRPRFMNFSGQGQKRRKLVLRTIPETLGASSGALTCWADLKFR